MQKKRNREKVERENEYAEFLFSIYYEVFLDDYNISAKPFQHQSRREEALATYQNCRQDTNHTLTMLCVDQGFDLGV